MGVLYLRNVPDDLLHAVRVLAAADRRAVNAQAIVMLEEAVQVRADSMSPAQMRDIGLAAAP